MLASAGSSDANKTASAPAVKTKVAAPVFGVEDEDDDTIQKKRAPLQKIDFGGVEASGRQERLAKLKASVKRDKESVFKAKIRWDGITDVCSLICPRIPLGLTCYPDRS